MYLVHNFGIGGLAFIIYCDYLEAVLTGISTAKLVLV